MSIIPGEDITKMLAQWDEKNENQSISKAEFDKFAFELALTLKEYEKMLLEQIKGHDIEMAYKTRLFENTIKDLKEKTQMHIEAYEMSFTDLKLKHMQEQERVLMSNCELESQIMNSAIPEY